MVCQPPRLLALLVLTALGVSDLGRPAAAATYRQQHAECAAGGIGASQLDELGALRQALRNDLQVILVLDPNFEHCWEAVPVNALSRATLLCWASSLRDVLTATEEEPEGHPLLVSRLAQECCPA